jgi:hypothetical protein
MKKQIEGIICFQHMPDALDAAIALTEAGFETEIDHEMIDLYSNAGFLRVWCYVDGMAARAAAEEAFWTQVQAIAEPFDGLLDDAGFSDARAPEKLVGQTIQ